MWTKQYLTKPTKEQYFKTKHPIGAVCMLVPMLIYYLFCKISGINSWWMLVGMLGCLTFGVGLVYAFAMKLKIYEKALVPALCLLCGGALIVLSLFLAW